MNETPSCLDDIEGIQRIRYADQLLIIRKINETPIDFQCPIKRARLNNTKVLDSDIVPLIAQQNEKYYKIYDAMNEKNVALPERDKKQRWIEFLDSNNQAKLMKQRCSSQDVSSTINFSIGNHCLINGVVLIAVFGPRSRCNSIWCYRDLLELLESGIHF